MSAMHEAITGWEPLSQKSQIRPVLHELDGVTIEDSDAVEYNDEEEDDLRNQHWCADDVFMQGGVRSVSVEELENEANKQRVPQPLDHVLPVPQHLTSYSCRQVKSVPAVCTTSVLSNCSEGTPRNSPMDAWCGSTKTASVDPERVQTKTDGEKACASVGKKKRGRLQLNVSSLNHTRVMERPLKDILGTAAHIDDAHKLHGEGVGSNSKGAVKRRPDRPTRGNKLRLTVPSKFRD